LHDENTETAHECREGGRRLRIRPARTPGEVDDPVGEHGNAPEFSIFPTITDRVQVAGRAVERDEKTLHGIGSRRLGLVPDLYRGPVLLEELAR